MVKKICILGATGSIGRNCLSVVSRYPDRFKVVSLSARTRAKELVDSAAESGANCICLAEKKHFEQLDVASLSGLDCCLGPDKLMELVTSSEVDIVVNALVGAVGLSPSIAALKAGKRLALANKESLVMAGEYLMNLAAETEGAEIIPVDSEHSALFQLLESHGRQALSKITLTASGGPFRGYDRERLEQVSFADSQRHPTWSMGPKINIDSSTLANKGLEVIEAHYLFGIDYDDIEVVVHPQSFIHAMVQFSDGAVMAHMGLPDMRVPIQYALTFPERLESNVGLPDFASLGRLTFEKVDRENFPCLDLAYSAGRMGGLATAVYNAANEVAVDLFMNGKIEFTKIPIIIERTLYALKNKSEPGIDDIFEADGWAREYSSAIEFNTTKTTG